MTGFIIAGVVLALVGAALMMSGLLPDDAMVAVPLPGGAARRALLPAGVLVLVIAVILPVIGVTQFTPPPTPTPTMTYTPTMTPSNTPTATRTEPPTIPVVPTATPLPPTPTPSDTYTPSPTLGTLAPQQSLRQMTTPIAPDLGA